MPISVVSIAGEQVMTVDATPTTTVGSLRRQAAEMTSLPERRLRLVRVCDFPLSERTIMSCPELKADECLPDHTVLTLVRLPADRVVTASHDGTARIWDSGSRECLQVLSGHEGKLCSAVFSPDGRWVLTGSHDGTARIWLAETGRCVRTIEVSEDPCKVDSAAFSPNGKFVLVVAEDEALLWSLETVTDECDQAFGVEGEPLENAVFSPEGTLLVTSSDCRARLWNVASGECCRQFPDHDAFVNFATFSPDGRMVFTASWDATVKIWDAQSGACRCTLEAVGVVTSVAFSPDGCTVVFSRFDGLAVHVPLAELADKRKYQCIADSYCAYSASLSSDGSLIVTTHESCAKLWAFPSGQLEGTLTGHSARIVSATCSPCP